VNATRTLAEYAAQVRFEDLPANVVLRAKHVIRDSLGCLLGGTTFAPGKHLTRLLLPMAADGLATVAGTSRHVTAPLASYINAQLTNLMDYDDTLEGKALGHPGATTIPVALALAEQSRASGKDFLTAVAVAYDVYTRVAAAGKPTYGRNKQVRGLATWQGFGAVTAAARILKLDAEATTRAFGMAALHAPVPFVGKIYEERPLWELKNNYGWVALGGVLAALYASENLPANHAILDGQTGFWIMAGSDQCDFSLLTQGLGTEYSILDVSIKPYSSCRHTHSPLDALRSIIQAHDLRADDVQAVHMRGDTKIKVFENYRPSSAVDAEFSLPYITAMLLLREPTGYGWFDGEPWNRPAVQQLADRVQLEVDAEAEAQQAKGSPLNRVSVELSNGRVLQGEARFARGHPQNPLSPHELEAKFLGLAERAIGKARANELAALLDTLEQVSDISKLSAYLIT
jgi:2-methylcitrate dehydratase PrpD